MPIRNVEVRTVTLVDIPLIRRLNDQVTVLNSEIGYTRDVFGPNEMMLTGILPSRHFYTMIARSNEQQALGQFWLRPETSYAHMVYLAPKLEDSSDDTAWLCVLDAMAREAGKHDAHALIAEVYEDSYLFETLRTAGYAVYARQQIWQRSPGDYPALSSSVEVTEATEADEHGIQRLLAHVVPPFVQQITEPPADLQGWVYRKNDKIEAYIAIAEGKHGVYLIPYLHMDINDEVVYIFDALIHRLQKASKVPVYVRVYRYQGWISSALETLQFERGLDQAVMVKHLTAGVRRPTFDSIRQGLKAMINPPSQHSTYEDILWRNE